MPATLKKSQPEPLAHARPELSIIQPVHEVIRTFPSTRYYGSKRKLLPWIYEHVRTLPFESALDIFGGTASVSLLLKAMRKTVTYHDGFRFNEDVGRTLLSNGVAIERQVLLDFLGEVAPKQGTITELFSGMYYTAEENAWLDGFLDQLDRACLPDSAASLLRYLLYQACLKKRPFNLFHRANLHLRTGQDVKRSFGNYTTWQSSFDHHMLQAYEELTNRPSFPKDCKVLPAQNAENVPTGHDLVYIDPPYINVEERYNRDDYWRRYHFLEGIAQYREWGQRIDPSSKIKLLQQPQWMIDWARQKTFSDRLFGLIERHKNSIVVLSYVTNAYPDDSEIRSFFERRFANVSMHTREHNHALSRSPRRELLFIGHPRS